MMFVKIIANWNYEFLGLIMGMCRCLSFYEKIIILMILHDLMLIQEKCCTYMFMVKIMLKVITFMF
jgi:hypothetical protein